MSNTLDLISDDLGIAHGINQPFDTHQQQNAQVTNASLMAGVANHQLMLHGPSAHGFASNPQPSRGNHFAHGPRTGTPDDKTARRRKRERESAQRSRQRKQGRLQELQIKVDLLSAENNDLKAQIKLSNVDSLMEERNNIADNLSIAIEHGYSSTQLSHLITEFNKVTEYIVNLNAKGAETIATSLDRSHIITVVLWMFISGEKKSNGDVSVKEEDIDKKQEAMRKIGSKMNHTIRKELHLTDEQYDAILEKRDKYFESFKAAYDENKQAFALVEQLEKRRAAMAHYFNVSKSFLEHVLQKVLSENQLAKLLVWLHHHQHLLRSVFSESNVTHNK